MDRSRSTNKTLAIFSMSLLLATTSVKAMQRRNREISSIRVQSDNSPWRTPQKIPAQNYLPDSSHSSESLEGVVISGLSRLKIDNSKIDTRPRTSSRFFFRKPNGKAVIDSDEDIDIFSMETGRGQSFASTSTGGRVRRYPRDVDEDVGEFSMENGRGQTFASSSGRVRRHPRDILNLPRLNVRRVADVSSEENAILSRTESSLRSPEREFKKAYGSDGSWEYARRLRKEKRLEVFCTSVQRINGDGLSLVKDAHLTSALLNLGSKTINAEMIRFTTARKPRYTYYITKGLRADCVFALTLKSPRAVVFFLGKHVCNIEGPSPVRPSLKKRTLQHSTTTQALFSRLGKLFGLLNTNKSSKE